MKRIVFLLATILLLASPIFASQTWYVRSDGGTRKSANVPAGQCDGLSDLAAAGAVSNHCAFNDFRYMWSDNFTSGAGTWVISGGDTVVIRGCAALGSQANPANPDCRIGFDEGNDGNPPNSWCPFVGAYTCYNPPIPAGTSAQHTRILGQCAFGTYTCTPVNTYPLTSNNLTQLFGGFGLNETFNVGSTQYVDIEGIELTTHNRATDGRQCTRNGSPAYPQNCSSNVPLDDYADSGFLTNNTTANITFQDVYVHGFAAHGFFGPIGGPITMTRVFIGFNGQSGWNFDDGHDTADGAGSSINASYVTMMGNGCYEEYPIVHTAFPAHACYDPTSNGFGDGWSGQDTTLSSFICDHCRILYNTKDGFIGPHTQIVNLQITNSVAIGNMGAQWKWGRSTNSTLLFQNNLTVTNCLRMAEAIPGAAQNFNQSTGLGGSYLTNFCRAGGAGFANVARAGGVSNYYGNTIVAVGSIVFQEGCGFYSTGNVFNTETNCGTSTNTVKDNNLIGYTDPNPILGQPSALYYPLNSDGSTSNNPSNTGVSFTGSYNNEIGFKGGTTDTCGTNNITCVSPLLTSQPTSPWPGSEAAFDVFNASVGGNSFYPTGSSPLLAAGTTIGGLTTDYYATTRPSPPAMGAVELGGTPTVATPTASPVAGSYTSAQTVTLSTVTAGATICYTTNGTTPAATVAGTCDGGSTTYSGAISVSVTTTIKALGTLVGDLNSSVFSGLYTITLPAAPTVNTTNVKLGGTVVLQ